MGEKNMERNNGNQSILQMTWASLWRRKGRWGKNQKKLSAFHHFLVDAEMENGRHKLFNFQMSKLDTKIINEKLEEVFNKLNSAA